jgi:hypothetical protein
MQETEKLLDNIMSMQIRITEEDVNSKKSEEIINDGTGTVERSNTDLQNTALLVKEYTGATNSRVL